MKNNNTMAINNVSDMFKVSMTKSFNIAMAQFAASLKGELPENVWECKVSKAPLMSSYIKGRDVFMHILSVCACMKNTLDADCGVKVNTIVIMDNGEVYGFSGPRIYKLETEGNKLKVSTDRSYTMQDLRSRFCKLNQHKVAIKLGIVMLIPTGNEIPVFDDGSNVVVIK